MAIAGTSCEIRDQSPTQHSQRILQLNDRRVSDSHLSSRFFAESCQDLHFSFDPQGSVEDFQQQCSEIENSYDLYEWMYPETTALSFSTTAISNVANVHIMQGNRQGTALPYPDSQQLCIGQEFIGLPDDTSSFGFNESGNEFADLWEDNQYHPQVMTTPTVPISQRNGWNEGSTSSTTTGDIWQTDSTAERNYLECSRALQHERTSESDATLPVSLKCQQETPEKTMFSSRQPCTSSSSRFHFQALARDEVLDSSVNDHCVDTVDDSKTLGSQQHIFVQQELWQSIPSSRELTLKLQRPEGYGICPKAHLQFTSENGDQLKLKQKALAKPARRKYQRRRNINKIDVDHDEIDCVSQPNHVERERRRRFRMTGQISELERLLPKSTKRDRISTVFDTIQLLQKLERDVQNLQKQFHEAKLRRARHEQSRGRARGLERPTVPESIDGAETTGRYLSNEIVINRIGTSTRPSMKPVTICPQPSWVPAWDISGKFRPTHLSPMTQFSGGSNGDDKGSVFVEFHVHLDDTVTGVHEQKYFRSRCRMDYLRRMVGVVEEFKLDFITCNIMKLSGYCMCVIGLTARTSANFPNAAEFAVRLESVVNVDVVARPVISSLQFDTKIPELKVRLHPVTDKSGDKSFLNKPKFIGNRGCT